MSGDGRTDRELLLEILDRLRRLEEVQASTLRKSQAVKPATAPLRVSPKQAATILGVSVRTVCIYASRGLLVRLPKPKGSGKSTRTYFAPDNVTALAESEDAAREWVARRKYVNLSKR